MSDAHWATMVEKYSTEQAKKKSAKAAKSRKSALVGKRMHKHGASPRCFLNIQYNMMVDEGLDEPPSYTALARKTHTGKDGSFLDERTEELVLDVEEAVEEMLQDGSPHGDSQTDSTAASNAKRYLLNQEYIKRGNTKKGTIYGLGSAQYKNISPSVPIPVSLKRNLDVDMRMSGFETTISEVKEDIAGVKEDFTALKTEINAFKTEVTGGMSASQATLNIILQTLQSQASTSASTAQPFQPQAQSQHQGQPQAPVQSHHQPQPQAQSTAPPQHLST
uniref:Transposase Tnp1/En/Spm-like domain-containing protein n=1 Tax=Brassica oleracea var. oleracea TaxID=109376 RepID=A0A0D3CIY8_BRAOL